MCPRLREAAAAVEFRSLIEYSVRFTRFSDARADSLIPATQPRPLGRFSQKRSVIMAKCAESKRQVKLELAAKYKRLAKVAGSDTKRKTYEFHARRFTNQAAAMAQAAAFAARNQ